MELSGWGRWPRAWGTVARPERVRTLQEAAASPSVIARGLGRSYGDASYNSVGLTIRMDRLNRFLAFDPETGLLECEAGVTLGDIIRILGPRGFYPPILPDTRFVTIGGAIACDIHGKNHERDGSFAGYVRSFTLLNGAGETLTCSRNERADLFWATIGGMGLTGVIVDAVIQLRPRASSRIIVDRQQTRDLDGAVRLFDEGDARYGYSYAWIDSTARGARLGRGVVMRGNEDPAARNGGYRPPPRVPVPAHMPAMLNGTAIRAFNEVYYRTHPSIRGLRVDSNEFFFRLDSMIGWNHLYGGHGFAQYQCMLPESGVDALAALLERISHSTRGAFLAIMQKFGAADYRQMLSFAGPGYTLAVDFPARTEVMQLLHDLDHITATAGGRVYLAKDARVRSDVLAEMYPQLPQWLSVKAKYDSEKRFESDMSRRLAIT